MSLIRVDCNKCGKVDVQSRRMLVLVCEDTLDATYRFRCPVCEDIEVREALPHVVDNLTVNGVHCIYWHMPEELSETHHGPAITYDDIIDLHDQLESDDWPKWLGGGSSDE